MLIDEFHPEDIKAAIRKRYRSLGAFERALGLPKQGVSEILRGRTSARIERAIRRVMAEDARWGAGKTIIPGNSSDGGAAHRLSERAA
jgi:lambda repressor-like predicted transcriptional regulator